jgi:8-oxo-dGTP pyrophosphatase MutT (NUDIX family)
MTPSTPSRVRVLLVSPNGRVLLIKYRNTGPSGLDNPCWITPGGGMEEGESIADTALREIREETGLAAVKLGPVVWYGEDSERSGDWQITFKEHFIVAHSPAEELRNDGWTEHEQQQILEMRWWSIQEISESYDQIYPPGLHDLLTPVLAGEYPTELRGISAPHVRGPL